MAVSKDFRTVLQECSSEQAYLDTCKRISRGREFDPHELDSLWHELRTQKDRYLRKSDVEQIFSEDKAHYGYYWKVPSAIDWGGVQISLHESERSGDIEAIERWKHNVVQRAFTKLQSMEVASVVLASVYPNDFGVYSPPTLMLLQVPPEPPIQHFLSYCRELREWGRQFLDTEGIGTTDHALWVFYQSAYGHHPDPTVIAVRRKAFQEDEWIRRRHAKKTLKSYFSKYSPLEQARFLLDIDVYLSATIAGCEFEARLKELVDPDERTRIRKIRRFQEQELKILPQFDLQSIIEYLAAKEGYAAKRERFHEIRDLRNKAIHHRPDLTRAEAERMIAETEAIPKRNRL